MTINVLQAIFEIFALFGIGLLARRRSLILEADIRRLSFMVIDLLFPMLVFHSIVRGLKREQLAFLWQLPLAGFSVILLGALLGWLFAYCLKNPSPDTRRTFIHFCAVNNYGFLPILVVQHAWGETALAHLFLLNLGSLLAHWTIGVGILSSGSRLDVLKNVFSPALVAILLAVSLVILDLGWIVPPLILKVMRTAGSIAVPLVLIIIGASLAGATFSRQGWNLVLLLGMRLLLIPAVIILALACLPLSPEVSRIIFLVSLMPVSASSTLFTRRFGGDPDFASAAAVTTTLVSAVTIPLAFAWIAPWLL